MSKFYVGQPVTISRVNMRRSKPGEIVRVGRKLVDIRYTDDQWHHVETFRIDTRRTSDGYGHNRFRTMEEQADHDAREELAQRMRNAGWGRVDYLDQKLSLSKLERIVAILEEKED